MQHAVFLSLLEVCIDSYFHHFHKIHFSIYLFIYLYFFVVEHNHQMGWWVTPQQYHMKKARIYNHFIE